MYDLLLTGGTVIDGTLANGAPGARYRDDVAIAGDRIAAIGNLAASAARKTLDVSGLVIAPGFIDVHNHDEGWLLRTHNLTIKTSQGFTSEVLMSDGISYAPLTPETARDWFFYLRPLDALRPSEYRGWRSIADYLALLDRRNVQNVIALAPYANLRVLACGWGRAPADDLQISLMRRELRQAMEAGACGLSTGLDYIAECFATTDEIVRVAEAMAPYDGLYVTHVRYKEGTLRGVQEAVDICRRAGVRLHISHLKAGTPGEAESILNYLDQVASHEVDWSFDIYPYLAGSTLLSSLLPYEVWEEGPLAAPARLREPSIRQRFGAVMSDYPVGLERITVAWVASRENASLIGKSLAAVVEERGGHVGDVLADLLLDEAFCVLTVFHVGDDALVAPFLKHPRQMVGSDGIYFPDAKVHPRVAGTATRMLGPLVREAKLFSLEEVVRKLASYPAERFGLARRGTIEAGHFADLVILDPERVTDRATYEEPLLPSEGIIHVLTNGVPIVADGIPATTDHAVYPGRALRFRQSD